MKAEGIAKFSPAGIVFQFESKYFGLVGDGAAECAIPIARILDLRFKRGLFKIGARIVVRLNSLVDLNGLPKTEGNINLKIKRVDFERALEAVELITDCMSGINALPEAPEAPVSGAWSDSEATTRELR